MEYKYLSLRLSKLISSITWLLFVLLLYKVIG